jgi:hypothetical protein
MPPPGVSTTVNMCKRSVKVNTTAPSEIGFPCLADCTLLALLRRFSLPDLVLIVKHLLCEHSVIFQGRQLGGLTACMLAALSLLGVFKWVDSVFGVLAQQQLGALGSPVPFVAGVLLPHTSGKCPELDAIAEACASSNENAPLLVVDVDKHTLRFFPDTADTEMPHIERLQSELSRPMAQMMASPAVQAQSDRVWITVQADDAVHLAEFKSVFAAYYSSVINSVRRRLMYKHYACTDDITNRNLIENISLVFPKQHVVFYRKIMNSSVWQNVIAPEFTAENFDPLSDGPFS